MRLIAALCMVACLGACAHKPQPEPIVRTAEVPVPVMVTCAAKEPDTTPYPDTDAALQAAADIYRRVQLLMMARALRPANEAILRAARAGCEGVTLEDGK